MGNQEMKEALQKFDYSQNTQIRDFLVVEKIFPSKIETKDGLI